MNAKTRNMIADMPGPGEGRLVLKLADDTFIRIGKTRIYLNYINHTGNDGGKREISLQIIGPTDVQIDRGIAEPYDGSGNR